MPSIFLMIPGIGHAFGRELGCPCNRCTAIEYDLTRPSGRLEAFSGWNNPPWRAHTSATLLMADDGMPDLVKSVVQVDFGGGVPDSMVASRLKGLENLDGILTTHGEHPDHRQGLNQALESIRRAWKRQNRPFVPIPYYTSRVSYDHQRTVAGQDYELSRFVRFQQVVNGVSFVVPGPMGVSATPIEVAHGWCEGAVIFVLEVAQKKVVCMWDIDSPAATRPGGGPTNRERISDNRKLLAGADVLLISTNTWKATGTGHASYEEARWYIESVAAKQTLCLHVSGHEDESEEHGLGWSDERWDKELNKEGVRLARQGQILLL